MASRNHRYHSLLVRESPTERWGIHFGDYDFDTVAQERADICEREYKKKNTCIITTADDQQSINERVAMLNSHLNVKLEGEDA